VFTNRIENFTTPRGTGPTEMQSIESAPWRQADARTTRQQPTADTIGRIQASIAINGWAGSPTTGHRKRSTTSKPPVNNKVQPVGRAMPAGER